MPKMGKKGRLKMTPAYSLVICSVFAGLFAVYCSYVDVDLNVLLKGVETAFNLIPGSAMKPFKVSWEKPESQSTKPSSRILFNPLVDNGSLEWTGGLIQELGGTEKERQGVLETLQKVSVDRTAAAWIELPQHREVS